MVKCKGSCAKTHFRNRDEYTSLLNYREARFCNPSLRTEGDCDNWDKVFDKQEVVKIKFLNLLYVKIFKIE